jgi:hypothetical protein
VAGFSERQFLDFCRANPSLVASVGKLRAIPVDDLVRHLRVRRTCDADEAAGVDELLALVGRQRAS